MTSPYNQCYLHSYQKGDQKANTHPYKALVADEMLISVHPLNKGLGILQRLIQDKAIYYDCFD